VLIPARLFAKSPAGILLKWREFLKKVPAFFVGHGRKRREGEKGISKVCLPHEDGVSVCWLKEPCRKRWIRADVEGKSCSGGGGECRGRTWVLNLFLVF
jgi:hypothetical protein